MHGVRATLIDLGLSRMDAGDGSGGEKVHWTPFEEEIFMGEGASSRVFFFAFSRAFIPPQATISSTSTATCGSTMGTTGTRSTRSPTRWYVCVLRRVMRANGGMEI